MMPPPPEIRQPLHKCRDRVKVQASSGLHLYKVRRQMICQIRAYRDGRSFNASMRPVCLMK